MMSAAVSSEMDALSIPPSPLAPDGSSEVERLRHQVSRLRWILAERAGHPTNPRLRVRLRTMAMELEAIAHSLEGASTRAPMSWRVRRGFFWRARRVLRELARLARGAA